MIWFIAPVLGAAREMYLKKYVPKQRIHENEY